MTTDKAPERVWINPPLSLYARHWRDTPQQTWPEYIRADLYEKLKAERDELEHHLSMHQGNGPTRYD